MFTSIITAAFVFLYLAVPVYACSKIYKRTLPKSQVIQEADNQRVMQLEHELMEDYIPQDGSAHPEGCPICIAKRTTERDEYAYLDYVHDLDFYYNKHVGLWTYSQSIKKETKRIDKRRAQYKRYKELYGERTAKAMIEREEQ